MDSGPEVRYSYTIQRGTSVLEHDIMLPAEGHGRRDNTANPVGVGAVAFCINLRVYREAKKVDGSYATLHWVGYKSDGCVSGCIVEKGLFNRIGIRWLNISSTKICIKQR